MSTQNPTIPTPTDPKGIDLVVSDLQTLLDTSLVWLTNGMGRAYRLTKVRANQTTVFLPEVYLGVANRYDYFAATPDNDKQGQNIFFVGDANLPDQQKGFYGWVEHEVGIIFSANLETIDSALLATEDFTEHLIQDVREVLIRLTVGKGYRINIDSITREFDDVYAEFDVSRDRGVAHAPMTHFRFNCTITFKEDCTGVSLDRCNAILQNVPQSVLDCVCGVPETNQYSMSFDGVNERIIGTTGAPYNLEWSDSFSFGFWFKSDLAISLSVLLSKWFNQTGFYVGVTNSGRIRVQMRSGAFSAGRCLDVYTDIGTVTASQWTHGIVTNNGGGIPSSLNAYVDGTQYTFTLVGLQPISSNTIITASANLEFAASSNLSIFSECIINDVRIWNKELSSSEALQEWNSGTPLSIPVANANLIGHNTMGDNAAYGLDLWAFDDLSTSSTGYKSINMEQGDRVIDTP